MSSTMAPVMQNVSIASVDYTPKGVMSREVLVLFEYVLDVWFCLILSIFGIIANILTIMVYSKMGFKETVNISMTTIASWDLVKCITIICVSMPTQIQTISVELGLAWLKHMVLPLRILNNLTGYVSGAMAAYVAIERCLCVCMPFSVKSILNRQVVITVCVVISILVPISYIAMFFVYDTLEVIDPKTNETYLFFQRSTLARENPIIAKYTSTVGIIYPLVSLLITVVCTVIIQYQLKKASKFRSQITTEKSTDKSSQLSARDRQVIKMLVVIILVYIVCFTPRVASYVTNAVYPEYGPGRRYHNLVAASIYLFTVFDLVNASINIFIFYSMSSGFKATMNQLFHVQKKKN